jgi:hypothetical protein
MDFNINEIVLAKLTDHGRAVHASDHAIFWAQHGKPAMEYRPPKEDAEGWSRWQMWDLMRSFGQHTGLAMPPCFETTIRIPEPATHPKD